MSQFQHEKPGPLLPFQGSSLTAFDKNLQFAVAAIGKEIHGNGVGRVDVDGQLLVYPLPGDPQRPVRSTACAAGTGAVLDPWREGKGGASRCGLPDAQNKLMAEQQGRAGPAVAVAACGESGGRAGAAGKGFPSGGGASLYHGEVVFENQFQDSGLFIKQIESLVKEVGGKGRIDLRHARSGGQDIRAQSLLTFVGQDVGDDGEN